MPEGTQTPPASLQFKDLIAEAGLTDRGWAKDFADKPLDKDTGLALLKKLDGAETLIGKKTLIPGADAKPEEVEAFLSKLRPAKADDYGELKMGEKADPEFVKTFREAAHHAGMDKRQVDRQLEKLVPVFAAHAKKQADAAAARDVEFQNVIKENMGGADWDKRTARAKTAARELVPEVAKKFIDKMDDGSLVLFTTMVDAVLKKYAGEGDFNGGEGAAGGGAGASKDELIKELHTLYAKPERNDFKHADHDKVNKRIEEILASPALKA